MNNYDIILFDADETLLDFRVSEREAFRQVFETYGVFDGVQLYLKSYNDISKTLWSNLENGSLHLSDLGPERFKRLFAQHQLEFDPVVFNQDYLGCLGKQAHLIEGAEQVIRALSHKRLAIITNGFAEVQTSRVKLSPFHGVFEQVITSETAGCQKPLAGIFDFAFEKLNVTDKSKVLLVGDSLTSDIQGGASYGIDTCWYNPTRKENHTTVQPTYEIDTLERLLDLIK